MCSILFSTRKHDINQVMAANRILQLRGPDNTSIVPINDHLFVHNLLSITGEFKTQPYIDGDIVVIYNGEIYNYLDFGRNYKSDGECIIPLYKFYGPDFIKCLDGEFAICLVDYSKQIAIFSTDIFKTKPLFIAKSGKDIACSTYSTPLIELGYSSPKKCQPNLTYIVDLHTGAIRTKPIYEFNLDQRKDSYEDWVAAFRRSVEKRVQNTDKNFFLGLSSGYDSGIIHSELQRINPNCYTFTLTGSETQPIIDSRIANNPSNIKSIQLPKSDKQYQESHEWIVRNTEPFQYTIKSSSSGYTEFVPLTQDFGSNNFATICKLAIENKCKICFSGTGADEIISDYGFNGRKLYNHSNFGGLFPEDLRSIFPWASFYGSTMESYIAKEEYVGGSFGIEVRYPFLDKDVVQEFLWLDARLKNRQYKAPIDFYLRKFNIPFEQGVKKGF